MNFSEALTRLKMGYRARRSGWNGSNQWIAVQRADNKSKMTLSYLYISTVQGDLVPWLASQTDILAEDWESL